MSSNAKNIAELLNGDVTVTATDIADGSVTSAKLDTNLDVDIDSGTIDGVTIGGASAGAGTFTTLSASGDVNFDTDTFFVDASEKKVGINSSDPDTILEIDAGVGSYLQVVSGGDNITRLRNYKGGDTGYQELSLQGSDISFRTGTAGGSSAPEVMRIDSSGNVGIGTDTVTNALTVQDETGNLSLGDTRDGTIHLQNQTSTQGQDNIGTGISFSGVASGRRRAFIGTFNNHASDPDPTGIMFATMSATTGTTDAVNERMRIESAGRVLVGYTTAALGSVSIQVGNPDVASSSGAGGVVIGTNGNIHQATTTSAASYFNDSSSSAGTHNYLIWRFQGSNIGDIDTTDNSTVRYNTFTGGHWTQFEDGTQPDLPVGTVLSTVDDLLQWTEYEYTHPTEGYSDKTTVAGFHTIGETKTIYIDEDGATAEGTALSHDTAQRIAKCKVSGVAGDRCVYGVFAGHYKDGDSSVESLGLGVIRIGSGVTVQRGDLLESAGDGTARPQTGDTADLFKAGTIAKVTSTTVVETYDDGSYTIPCTLHCG